MVIQKNSVSDFVYLYGKEAHELPVSIDERILMHTEQAKSANELLQRLLDVPYADRDRDRINDVIACEKWNRLMLDKLKGKK